MSHRTSPFAPHESTVVAAGIVLLAFACTTVAEDAKPPAHRWPGFLGAGAAEVPADSIPLEWTETEHVAWQSKLAGYGQSSPVAWGETVYVTAVEGPEKERGHVVALNLADGSERWRKTFDSARKEKSSYFVSRAAPTPVVDARGVYAFFESGDLVAYSHEGEQLWQRSLQDDYGDFDAKFGLAASPAQTVDHLFVLVDNEGPSYLLAVDKQTGETTWKADRTSRQSWSSPTIVTVAGQPQVVVSSEGSVDGYETKTGRPLWTVGDVGGNTSSTPLPFAEGTFLVGASAGREGNNTASARQSNFAMQVTKQGDEFVPEVLWRTQDASPTFGSPIVHAGQAYWVNRAGVVYCYDAKTGEERYTQRIDAQIWATPLGIGDRVYFFGKDGNTVVLAAGPEFEVLATNLLWDPAKVAANPEAGANEDSEERRRSAAMFAKPVQYGVAAVPGSLLVRRGDVLYCLRND